MTRVANLYREKYDVYIGRANSRLGLAESKWHNPYYIGIDGTREEVIEKYRNYVLGNPYLMGCLHELKDKTLGCYCKPKACHGDVLVDLIESDTPDTDNGFIPEENE